jgi:hypothetical protein
MLRSWEDEKVGNREGEKVGKREGEKVGKREDENRLNSEVGMRKSERKKVGRWKKEKVRR